MHVRPAVSTVALLALAACGESTIAVSNRPPLIEVPPAAQLLEGEHLSLTVKATDPDEDVVHLSADTLPPGASFDPGTGVLLWTPSFADARLVPYVITFNADDGRRSTQQTTTVSVFDVNQKPILVLPTARTVREGGLLTFEVVVSDADTEDTVTVDLLNPPAGAVFDGRAFSWRPDLDQGGVDYVLEFLATDNHVLSPPASERGQVTVTVDEGNNRPALAALEPVVIAEGNLLALDLAESATDADGDALTDWSASWSREGYAIPRPLSSSLEPSGRFRWRPGFSDAGHYAITFAVTDHPPVGLSGTATTVLAVTVTDVTNECHASSDCPSAQVCYQGTCRALAGDPCAGPASCAEGMVCVGGTCWVDAGGACTASTQCLPEYQCDRSACRGITGAACGEDQDCASDRVCQDSACRVSLGGGCGASADCATELVCQDQRCRVPAGGACAVHTDCVTDDYCAAGSCARRPGAPCDASPRCAEGQKCVADTCRNPEGQPCAIDSECYVDLECVYGTCKEIPDAVLGVVDTAVAPVRLVINRSPTGSFYRDQATLISKPDCGGCTTVQSGRPWAVADFDGDHKADIVFAGRHASVLFGRKFGKTEAATYTLPDLDLKLEWTDPRGVSVVAAGDVNDDGYADILLGGYPARVAVIFGGPGLRSRSVIQKTGDTDGASAKTADALLVTDASWDIYTFDQNTVGMGNIGALEVGDFDGDGSRDILVGYMRVVTPYTGQGWDRTYLYLFRSPSPWLPRRVTLLQNPPPAPVTLWMQDNSFLGPFLALTDFSGEGKADLVVESAYNYSGFGVFRGGTLPTSWERAPLSPDHQVLNTGRALAVAQIEGQRVLLVTEPGPPPGSVDQVPLAIPPPATLDPVNSPSGIRKLRGEGDHEFGDAIAVADVDGDQKPDLAVGAPLGGSVQDSNKTQAGVLYILYGGNPALSGAGGGYARDADAKIVGPVQYARIAGGLAAGDFNGDGYAELFFSQAYPQSKLLVLFGGPRERPWRN